MQHHPGVCGPSTGKPAGTAISKMGVTPPLVRRGSRRAPVSGSNSRWCRACLRLALGSRLSFQLM
jgi:hypothetical protein